MLDFFRKAHLFSQPEAGSVKQGFREQRPEESRIVCALCGETARKRFALEHTAVWKCNARECGLQFAHPQLGDVELRRAYERFYYPRSARAAAPLENTPDCVLRQVFAALEDRSGGLAGLRLLDYGCGAGSLLRVARQFGMSGAGIEPDQQARRTARNLAGAEVYASAEQLLSARASASFDLIILWTVIEHLRWPWQDLARLGAMLSEGGRLLVSTINTRCLRARAEGNRWQQYRNPTHFYYFDRQSLGRVLVRGGFPDFCEWRLPLRFPHHSAPRRWLHRASLSVGLADGLLYLCTRKAREECLAPNRLTLGRCTPELDEEGIGSVA